MATLPFRSSARSTPFPRLVEHKRRRVRLGRRQVRVSARSTAALIRNFIERLPPGGQKMWTEMLISAMDEAPPRHPQWVELWPSSQPCAAPFETGARESRSIGLDSCTRRRRGHPPESLEHQPLPPHYETQRSRGDAWTLGAEARSPPFSSPAGASGPSRLYRDARNGRFPTTPVVNRPRRLLRPPAGTGRPSRTLRGRARRSLVTTVASAAPTRAPTAAGAGVVRCCNRRSKSPLIESAQTTTITRSDLRARARAEDPQASSRT